MKTVGKQLQEARLAKNWTPELAARETKIKVERVRDLEGDDYSNFTSPTYARGFVRTYARALGLDEYRILRQLDNKLPDDDSANIVTETGVAYLPETAMPTRAAHRDYTGLYIVMGLGAVVLMITAFVLFEAYRAGELATWFSNGSEPVAATANTNDAADTVARALPVDSNTPPPIADATTNAPVAADPHAPGTVANIPGVSPRALPVDLSQLPAAPTTDPAPTSVPPTPVATDIPVNAPRALPVDLSQLTNAPVATPPLTPRPETAASSSNSPVPPRALPVDPSELANPPVVTPATPTSTTVVAANTVAAPASGPIASGAPPEPVVGSISARNSDNSPVVMPTTPPADPAPAPAAVPAITPAPVTPAAIVPVAVVPPADPAPTPSSTAAAADAGSDKRLVLTAWKDSYVRVTDIDEPDGKQLYASVLHGGQSVGFDGKKFSINVGLPSAVNIKLDGVNYGPHSDQEEPETFTVTSHLP